MITEPFDPFQFFLAKLFGIEVIGIDDEVTSRGYYWRGILYVVEINLPEVPDQDSQRSS